MTDVRHLFTSAEAEQWLGIPAATVRSWARRHKVWAYGLTEDGRPMFDRDHLVALRDARKPREHAA
jgi:hypothetical protein